MDPLVLAFDLDHTLFEAKFDENEKSTLSSSAKLYRSSNDPEVAYQPVLKFDIESGKELKVEKVRAINCKEMASIFRQLSQMFLESKQKNLQCPVAVKIITSATYDEKYVLQLLDKFYFCNLQVMRDSNRFPIEFFNFNDLDNLPAVQATQNNPTNSGYVDQRKGTLISKMFPIWQKVLPQLAKQRVVLIDNADSHIAGVNALGFRGLHYPTTPEDRIDGITYSVHGKQTLTELHRLVDGVQQSIQNFQIGTAPAPKLQWKVELVTNLKIRFKLVPVEEVSPPKSLTIRV